MSKNVLVTLYLHIFFGPFSNLGVPGFVPGGGGFAKFAWPPLLEVREGARRNLIVNLRTSTPSSGSALLRPARARTYHPTVFDYRP
eukprot:1653073-Amphidinium_carterae.1